MLVTSLILSIVLTIVLNVVVRAFPGATDRGLRRIDGWAQSQAQVPEDRRRVRVYFPWKAMLIASVLGTILLNLIVR